VIDEGAEASLYNGKVLRAKRAHDCNGTATNHQAVTWLAQVFRAGPGEDGCAGRERSARQHGPSGDKHRCHRLGLRQGLVMR
jgi:hypothetical protein